MRQNLPTRSNTPDLRDVIAAGTLTAVDRWLHEIPGSWRRSEQVDDLTDAEIRRLVALLTPQTARELFDSIDTPAVVGVLEVLPPVVAAGLLDALDDDRSAEILRGLDDDHRQQVLAGTGAVRSATLRGLLSWPQDSAGSRMNPDVASVSASMTVSDAIEAIRARAAETTLGEGDVLVTASPDHRLVGVVSYLDLVLSQPHTLIATIMDPEVVSVSALEDQEVAARLLADHDLSAVPVVHDGALLGIISADDVVDILEAEATEDAERQGGSAPLEVPYLRASPFLLWRKRIVWLLVLFLAEMYTGTVLRMFEDELSTVVALTFFIPLLIGTGGNTGTQITTTMIRAMAMGQVEMRNILRVVRKEVATGVLIAATIAGIAWVRALTLGVGEEVAITVAISVVVIVLWTSLVASVLPLLLNRLGVDPAVVSGPMITTVVDGTGLIIYFTVARLVITQLGAG
ncbi:magnesium transporter [Sanguibacter gelidistatuariae]|uniref:Magnesium transporter MgtE n=1 Tax=Sanguibacter gelidistatuariae TaxID=1814289 RepID=A0A1G6K6F2_9MICO|nr:magnesium transporter [Sanguibacter gelidistatuariae]SDC26503.1 magnesium transporter [Sanguibacter gelidistatuariae]